MCSKHLPIEDHITVIMCCWGFEDVYLEDLPPKKKEKKEEDNNEYIMVSSDPPKPVEAPVSRVPVLSQQNTSLHLGTNIMPHISW